MGAPLNIYYIAIFLYLLLELQQKYIICENVNCILSRFMRYIVVTDGQTLESCNSV